MTTRRRKARQSTIEVLYRHDLVGDSPEQLVADVCQRLRLRHGTAQYFQRLVTETIAHCPEIDETLSATIKKWRLNRLSYVDRAILRMASCEILFFPDIPANVSINEAVELAKSFGDDKSGQFVNGILDAIAKQHPQAKSIL